MSRKNWSDEKLFERVLKNKSEAAVWDTIRELRMRASPTVFKRCVALTKSKLPKEREIGIWILAQLRYLKNPDPNDSNPYWDLGNGNRPFYEETTKLFFELLPKEKNLSVQETILYSIGYNNSSLNKDQVNALCSLSSHSNKAIQEALVWALKGCNDMEAIRVLIQFSSHKVNSIRDWATFGIGTLTERNNKEIREALWSRINDRHQDTRYEAIMGLAARKDPRVKLAIDKELQTEEYSCLLFEAILEFGDPEHFKILKKHYKKEKNNEELDPFWLKKFTECMEAIKEKLKNDN